MSAFFFGPDERPLYGYQHRPNGTVQGAILLCPPWGAEYQNAHRTLRILATRLARGGWHVLRFDWSGTGDSWGDTTCADLETWVADFELAADELVTRSACTRFVALGLRLGAVIAARAAAHRSRTSADASGEVFAGVLDRLVLWDPITDARSFALQTAADARAEEGIELSGQLVSRRFRDALALIGPTDFAGRLARRVLVLRTGEEPAGPEPIVEDDAFEGGTQIETVADASPWVEDVAIWSGRVPARSLDRICEWLADR